MAGRMPSAPWEAQAAVFRETEGPEAAGFSGWEAWLGLQLSAEYADLLDPFEGEDLVRLYDLCCTLWQQGFATGRVR